MRFRFKHIGARSVVKATLAAAVVSTLLTGAAVQAQERRLVASLNGDIRGTNPGVSRDANTDVVMHHIVEGLVGYSEDLRIVPVVASSYSVSGDGREYRFTLREGLRFHNGEPVTPSDVLWSWRRYLEPETKWLCRRWFVADNKNDDANADAKTSEITDIRVEGERDIVFSLSEANPLFLDRLANTQCISAILHPSSVGPDGEWLEPVATGPFMFEEWKPGEYIDLTRFKGYRPRSGAVDGLAGNKTVYADSARFLISPDASSTNAALLAGQMDLIPTVPIVSIPQLENKATVKLAQSPTLSWSILLMQTEDPVLKDVRIRKAIAHALDVELLIKFNTEGLASVNPSAVPVGIAEHTAAHDVWYEPSVEKAKALLKEAGYKGQVIKIQTNRKYTNMFNNALVAQAMLQAAGIAAQIEVQDWASQLGNYFSGKFQLSSFSYSPLSNPVLRYNKLIGAKAKRAVYQWDSEEAADVLSEAIAEYDVGARIKKLEELHALMREEVPIIGLYNAHNVSALGADIEGFKPWPLNLPRLWGVSKPGWRDEAPMSASGADFGSEGGKP
ncbi:ABC transporter substrate-binding protein [Kordiimonas sp.]|uniref:ABC transporter substrate-binding protein n=1 Tax=Kordiimonas sp. TaxID=1970157 RepID=UPI003A921006